MAITLSPRWSGNNDLYIGVHSDTKPPASPGDLFFETDTGDWFICSTGATWAVYTSPVPTT